jgi:transposase
MRTPATIVRWMDDGAMERWVHDAPTKAAYQRRLAIWWTATRGRHATEIADLLQTSTRSIRRWIQDYNRAGPAGLDPGELGGRQWAYLPVADERAILTALRARARRGRLVTAADVRATVEAHVGHAVSDAYLYGLLHRHAWRKVQPRPRHAHGDPAAQEAFKKTFRRSSGG